MGLKEYIIEAMNGSGRFNKATSTFAELKQNAKHLNVCKINDKDKEGVDVIEKFFNEVLQVNPTESKNIFMWADGQPYFKMDYSFGPAIETVLKNHSDKFIIPKRKGNKFDVKYVGDKKPIKIMEIGKGSIGRIQTSVQEQSTCYVFNTYMDIMEQDGEDMSTMNNIDEIRNIIADIYSVEVEDMDVSWLYSFGKQVKALVNLIRSFGGNPTDYRLARYGEPGKDKHVSKAYTNMIKAYTHHIGGDGRNRKDTYDPSDVILFNKNHIQDIKSICKAGKDIDDCMNIKKTFFEKLFITHICMGVSLKKITRSSGGKIDLFNVGSHNIVEKITSFDKIKKTKTNLTILCRGSFNFDGVTDENNNPMGSEKEVLLTMRTFGGNNVAVDVKLNEPGEPALGKCPVKKWRSTINCNSDSISECVTKFDKFLENKNLGEIADLIKYAIKEGPHCFPFILLH